MALALGASFLGFVSEMPSGPGVVPLKDIARIVVGLPVGTRSVLLTSKLTAHEIFIQFQQVNTWGIQIVDRLHQQELLELRRLLPKTQLVQVLHVKEQSAINEALGYTGLVDYLLLDSGDPQAFKKSLGGTGRTHDWEISHQICRQSPLPVLLAGGLNIDNIQLAVSKVSPYGVDLCSGVRTAGILDPSKLQLFMLNLSRSNSK